MSMPSAESCALEGLEWTGQLLVEEGLEVRDRWTEGQLHHNVASGVVSLYCAAIDFANIKKCHKGASQTMRSHVEQTITEL